MRVDIHRWTTPGLGSVNTYWIETDEAVIVIDGQRELSKAREALRMIEATGKPIAAVFLTHPHPDHFGGLGVFAPKGFGIPIYGSQQTRDSVAEDRLGLVKASRDAIKDDFPDKITVPDRIVSDGDTLNVAGVDIAIRELGAGEAECMTALYLPASRALFSADSVQHGMTAYLVEGRSGGWLAQLDRVLAVFPVVDRLYPGHGEPGSRDELIAWQATYLRTFRELVGHEMTAGALTEGANVLVAAEMERRYPGFEPVAAIPDLLKLNVAPTAAELGRQPPKRPPR